MKKNYKILIILTIAILLSIGLYQFLKTDIIYDEKIIQLADPIYNSNSEPELENDKKKMWNNVYVQLGGPKTLPRPSGGGIYSPNSAINAAYRVIQTEKTSLLGLTLKEALAKLKYSGHNHSFQIKNKNLAILQFSNELYDLQYDIKLNTEGKIESINKIEKHKT